MERSVIRGQPIPDYAEFIIGPAGGRTRWLHPGYTSRLQIRICFEASECIDQGSGDRRSEEHTSELQSHLNLVCRLLLEKKKKKQERVLMREREKEETNMLN